MRIRASLISQTVECSLCPVHTGAHTSPARRACVPRLVCAPCGARMRTRRLICAPCGAYALHTARMHSTWLIRTPVCTGHNEHSTVWLIREACMRTLKRGKCAFFWQISNFWWETSGGKSALVRAYLDGFEKVFL